MFWLKKRTQRHDENIVHDPRVRGRIYARHFIPVPPKPDVAEIQRQQAIRKRAIARKRALEQQRLRTPQPVQGRKHQDVQTDLYLEELSEVTVAADTECQTDEFLDRPATPLFIPAKSGKDAETQIEEGELFDFDVEVQPILEVLVGKTLEQSLLEVMEEEELAYVKAEQRAFRERRNKELAEAQRLQEQERRREEEKKRRIAEQREVLKQERELAEKIAARTFCKYYLADLVPTVFSSLRDLGYFYDPVEKDVEMNFLPLLTAEVQSKLEKRNTCRELLDTLIYEVTQQRPKDFKYLETESDKSDS